MTAYPSTTLVCDRQTRPPIDGIRTICGTTFGPEPYGVADTVHLARQVGWTCTGTSHFCPQHAAGRRCEAAC